MAITVVKPSRIDYDKKLEDFREESFDHLEDYEIDNLDKYCEEFLKNNIEVRNIVKKTKSLNVKMVIGFIIFGTIFNYFSFITLSNDVNYFWYFESITVGIILFWYFFLSPIRTHDLRDKNGFKDDKQFQKYRGVITPGQSILNQLKDKRTMYVVFSCLIIACVSIYSIFEDVEVTRYLNVVYAAYSLPDYLSYVDPDFSISTIPSTIPVILVLFMLANVIGFFAISYYERENKITEEKVEKTDFGKIILIGLFLALIVVNLILAIQFGEASGKFWNEDAHFLRANSDAAFTARWYTIILYVFIFLGAVGLCILTTLGLSGLEGGYIKMLYRQKIESIPPEEDVWEFTKTKTRHELEKKCFNGTRVYAAIELITVIFLAVWGYWTLWIYSEKGPMGYNPTIELLMTIELVLLVAVWVFVLSPYLQYRYERKYYFKDPHHSWGTVALEERGLGSPRTYFREDRKKHKTLIAYLLYFNLIGLWALIFTTIGDEDVMLIIFEPLGGSEAAVIPSMLIFYIVLNLIFLVYTTKITIMDNSSEGKAYKFVLLVIISVFTFSSVLIAFAFQHSLSGFNWTSLEFVWSMAITAVFFLLLAIVLYLLIFPLAVKFDNFEVSKADILQIFISTIILMAIFILIFDFFLPMTDASGAEIKWGYPFRRGASNDASVKTQNFVWGEFLSNWYGYLWWGAVQQFLFMSYFLRLLYKIFPHSKGFIPAALSSCIFGIIHYPDWPLMVFTGFGGLLWAYFWQKEYETKDGKLVRGNNLYLWGMVHGFGGSLVSFLIPISMSVGPFNA